MRGAPPPMRHLLSFALMALISLLLGGLLAHLRFGHSEPAPEALLQILPYKAAEARINIMMRAVIWFMNLMGLWRLQGALLVVVATAIFISNALTCLIIALSPMIFYLIHKHVLVRLDGAGAWQMCRLLAASLPTLSLIINGFSAYVILMWLGPPVLTFIIPEFVAIVLCTLIAVVNTLESSTPERLRELYARSWKLFALCVPLLALGAAVEALFILG